MASPANSQQAGIYLPAKKTIGNATITPKPTNGIVQGSAQKELNALSKPQVAPTNTNWNTTSKPATQGGLLSDIAVTQPKQPDAPTANLKPVEYQPVAGGSSPTMNTPQTDFTGSQYQSDGFTGVKGNTEFTHDPRSESLVQNQLNGLLDPESALMKRAVSQSQAQAASRGLQSSSLAAGAGTGAMIDRALPIAQQDAQTYSNADQLGWQQSFQADQNNQQREQDARMLDKQGNLQTNLQNNQFSFENAQQNANRQMQAELQQLQYQQQMGLLNAQGAQRMQELNAQQGFQAAMQELQYKQQMGVLDFQGQQQLQQMERSSQLNQQRDVLLQRFNDMNMDKSFLQQMQLTQQQYQQQDAMFEKQIDAQAQLDYRNAVSTGYNSYLEQVSNVYSNPNMTPEQQAAGVAKLGQLFEQQRLQMQAVFGFGSPSVPGSTTDTPVNPKPVEPATPINPNPGGGGGGGLLDLSTRPNYGTGPIVDDSKNWAVR